MAAIFMLTVTVFLSLSSLLTKDVLGRISGTQADGSEPVRLCRRFPAFSETPIPKAQGHAYLPAAISELPGIATSLC